jgi:hypothetical protein
VITQLGEAMHWVLFGLASIWLIAWIAIRALRQPSLAKVLPMPTRSCALLMLGATGLLTPLLMGLYVHAGYLDYRHATLLAMLLSPLAGAGGVFMADWMETFLVRPHPRSAAAIKLLALAIVCALMMIRTVRPLHEGKAGDRLAARQIAPELKAEDFVFTDSSIFLYYCRQTGVCFDGNRINGAQALHYIRHGNPSVSLAALSNRFLAANPAMAVQLRPPAFVEILPHPMDPESVSVFRVNRDAAGQVP